MKQVELSTEELNLINAKREEEKARLEVLRAEGLAQQKTIIRDAIDTQNASIEKAEKHFAEKRKFVFQVMEKIQRKNAGLFMLKETETTKVHKASYYKKWGDEYEKVQGINHKYEQLNKEVSWSDENYKKPTKIEQRFLDKWEGEVVELKSIVTKHKDYYLHWFEDMTFEYDMGYRSNVVQKKGEKEVKNPFKVVFQYYTPESDYYSSARLGMHVIATRPLPRNKPNTYKETEWFSYGRYYKNLNTICKNCLEILEQYNNAIEREKQQKKNEDKTINALKKMHPNAEQFDANGDVHFANGTRIRYGRLYGDDVKLELTYANQIELPNSEDESVINALLQFALSIKK